MDEPSVINNSLAFLLFICVIGGGLCLKCYQCDSSTGDAKCHWNRNFTQLLVEDCPTQSPPWLGEMGCARVNVTMLEDGEENWYVFRGCMPKTSCDVLKLNNLIKTRNFTTTECYICDSNLCNTKRRLKLGQLISE